MSVEVTIRNRQLFRKPLSIRDITAGKYASGHMDEYFRRKDGLIEGFNVLYNPEKIGRGIEFSWSDHLNDEIVLRMNYLSTKYDIEMFYDVIKNIMRVWKTQTFVREGETCRESDIDEWCASDRAFNLQFLADRDDVITVFGANIPLDLDFGDERIKTMCRNNDEEGYASFFHELQSIDAYYAVPIIYRLKETEYFGSYAVTADTDTIFPKKASDPLLFKDPATGGPLQCRFFTVSLVSPEEDAVIGRMSFEDFAEKAELNLCQEFDATHVFLKGLSEAQIHTLAASDHSDPLRK